MGTDAEPEITGYRIERVLGRGDKAVVYLAENLTLARLEALKVFSADTAADPLVRKRIERAATAGGKLDHPNIVKVYGHGVTEAGRPWIAMECVGSDAETLLDQGGITPTQACRIVTDVAAALDYAHSRGAVHGNVKPSNFLLGDNGRVVLTDFGTGVAYSAEGAEATVVDMAYAAPELLRGKRPDARSDEYALGCSLFRLLTGGQYPFSIDGGADALARAQQEQPPPKLSKAVSWASPMLDLVFTAALAKSPQERYRSAGELAADATRALEFQAPEPMSRPPAAPLEPVKPPPVPPKPAAPPPPPPKPVEPPPAPPKPVSQPVSQAPEPPKPVEPPPVPPKPVAPPPPLKPVGPPPPPPKPFPTKPVSRPPAPAPEAIDPPPLEPQPFPAVAGRRPFPGAALAAAAAAVAVVAIGTLVWKGFSGSSETTANEPASTTSATASDTSTTTSSSATPTPVSTADAGRLARLIPAGYPPGACAAAPETTASGPAAVTSCKANADLAAPSTSTYTLARSPEAMRAEFDRVTNAPGTETVVCPDNMQSPGPWRRLTNPDQPVGTLWCGLRGGQPVLAWTLDAETFIGSIQSPEPAALDQLYSWWASHS